MVVDSLDNTDFSTGLGAMLNELQLNIQVIH